MTLHGERGATFRLSIDGYQFPETTDDRWDANWLFVRGHVQHAQGEWTFRDPCLTTFEVQELAEWLDSIGEGQTSSQECSFTEPNLRFEYVDEGTPAIVARFAHESAPPWQLREERFVGTAQIFPVALNDLTRAASDLRAFLRQFPERGEAGGAA